METFRVFTQHHDSTTEYYLVDALGSVRQLTNSTGEVVLARAYDPYGSLVENNAYDGVTTAYGYAGEFTDASGMIYLRARYYSPAQGRFVSRDVWEGDYNNPLSLNKWGYVEGNPINFTDPSGRSSIHYSYKREKATDYAMAWDHRSWLNPKYDLRKAEPDMGWQLQCTLFASSVLSEGGVVDLRDDPIALGQKDDSDAPYWNIDVLMKGGWIFAGYADLNSWYDTNKFYNFITKDIDGTRHIGEVVLKANNPPQYNDSLPYSSATIDKKWEADLASKKGIIEKGDLVFYGNGINNWDHVAIVVGWGNPTSFGSKPIMEYGYFIGYYDGASGMGAIELIKWIGDLQNKCSDPSTELPSRPLVVERSGGIDYADYRSLDNTASKINYLEVVHIHDN